MRPGNVGPEKSAWRCPVVILPECIIGKKNGGILVTLDVHIADGSENDKDRINCEERKDDPPKNELNPCFRKEGLTR